MTPLQSGEESMVKAFRGGESMENKLEGTVMRVWGITQGSQVMRVW
jgi:hypothetical protein